MAVLGVDKNPQAQHNSPLDAGIYPLYINAMINAHRQLLSEIELFVELHGMSQTRFGILSVNDAKILKRLRAGMTCTLKTADRLRTFMEAYDKPKSISPKPRAPKPRSKRLANQRVAA